jgi:hypothetical protein
MTVPQTNLQMAEAGSKLVFDLMSFRVTGRLGDGFSIVRSLVAQHGKVRKLLSRAGFIRCEDDQHEAINQITDEVYEYLSRKAFNQPSAAIHCANVAIKHRAMDYVVHKAKEEDRHSKAVNKIRASMSLHVDRAGAIDELLDLREAIMRLPFEIQVHQFVWECLVNRHSYSIVELQDHLGVSYRQAKNINQTLSDFVRRW